MEEPILITVTSDGQSMQQLEESMNTNSEKANIGVLVGSMRKDSFNRKMAHALTKLAPAQLSLDIVEFKDLPIYNPDDDGDDAPQSYQDFRQGIRQTDGLLFLTPEYNRSVPGGLKNALDVGSRPYGQSVWAGKPAAIVSISPGNLGAFGANHHLRQSLVFLDMPAMAQPEAYIGGAAELFDENGTLVNEGTREFMVSFMTAFEAWVRTHR